MFIQIKLTQLNIIIKLKNSKAFPIIYWTIKIMSLITLCHHSDKLEISFGLVNTSPSTPIQIIKNICVFGDYHSSISFFSKISPWEIIAQYFSHFHHFKNGNLTIILWGLLVMPTEKLLCMSYYFQSWKTMY